jgi:hypothetical protein
MVLGAVAAGGFADVYKVPHSGGTFVLLWCKKTVV